MVLKTKQMETENDVSNNYILSFTHTFILSWIHSFTIIFFHSLIPSYFYSFIKSFISPYGFDMSNLIMHHFHFAPNLVRCLTLFSFCLSDIPHSL